MPLDVSSCTFEGNQHPDREKRKGDILLLLSFSPSDCFKIVYLNTIIYNSSSNAPFAPADGQSCEYSMLIITKSVLLWVKAGLVLKMTS